MLRKVNPGRLVELVGSFEVSMSLADHEGGRRLPPEFRGVRDRESRARVELEDLLRAFIGDPEDTLTGPIKITIEPA